MHKDESDVNRKAILLYYMSLLVFIAVGALELGYGIWVSGNPVRAGKVAKASYPLVVCHCASGHNELHRRRGHRLASSNCAGTYT